MAQEQLNQSELEVNCKGCGRAFQENIILRHIYNIHNVSCKESYSERELSSLKENAKSRKKFTNKEWKKNNFEKVSAHSQKWYNNHHNEYNNQRRQQYKDKNKSVQRAEKYQEDKERDQEHMQELAVERSKDNLEEFLVWDANRKEVELSMIYDGYTTKSQYNYEKRQIDCLKNYGVDVDNEQKLDMILSRFQEKVMIWKNEFNETIEIIKKEMGPRENWNYENRDYDKSFIIIMLINVEDFIKHDDRLLKYQAKDIFENIAEDIELTLEEDKNVILKGLSTTSREKCMDRVKNHTKYRDEIIHIYKTKSIPEEYFQYENIIQNLQNQRDHVSEYEKIRLRNIAKREALIQAMKEKAQACLDNLKQPAKKPAKKKQPKVLFKTPSNIPQSTARRTLPKRKCKK